MHFNGLSSLFQYSGFFVEHAWAALFFDKMQKCVKYKRYDPTFNRNERLRLPRRPRRQKRQANAGTGEKIFFTPVALDDTGGAL